MGGAHEIAALVVRRTRVFGGRKSSEAAGVEALRAATEQDLGDAMEILADRHIALLGCGSSSSLSSS